MNLNKYVKIKKHTFSVIKGTSHLPDSYALYIVECIPVVFRKTSKYPKHISGSHSHTRVLQCGQYGCTTKHARLNPVTGNSYTEVRGQYELSLHKMPCINQCAGFICSLAQPSWLQQCIILVSTVTQCSM